MSDSREGIRQLLKYSNDQAKAALSIVEAIVQDVDPLRKSVKVDWMDQEGTSNWLRSCWSMATDNGFAGSMPNVGDTVIVGFPQGIRDMGVILGQLTDPDMPGTDLKEEGQSDKIDYLIKTKNNVSISCYASGGVTVISNHVTVLSDDVKIGTAGNTNLQQFLVRFDKLKIKLDDIVAKFNAHFHTGNLGAPTTLPLPPNLVTPNDDYATNSIKAK